MLFSTPFSITGHPAHSAWGWGAQQRQGQALPPHSWANPPWVLPRCGVTPCARAKPRQTEPGRLWHSGGLCHLSCHWQVSWDPEENEHCLNPGSGLVCLEAQLSLQTGSPGCDSSARSSSSVGTPRGTRAPQPGDLSASPTHTVTISTGTFVPDSFTPLWLLPL